MVEIQLEYSFDRMKPDERLRWRWMLSCSGLLHGRRRPHLSLLTRIILVGLRAVRPADVGISVIDISLRSPVLRLRVHVGPVSRRR